MAYRTVDERFQLAVRGAEILYRQGAQRVWLFGSLAKGKLQDQHSDLDLIVEGLPFPFTYDVALDVSAGLGFPVDVMEWESMPPDYRGNVRHTLVLLPRSSEMQTATPRKVATAPQHRGLNQERLETVLELLTSSGLIAVLDLGCGNGVLLEMLACSGYFRRLTGVDYSERALTEALRKLGPYFKGGQQGIHLVHGLITCRLPEMYGHDAVTAVEVIEHLQPRSLKAFEFVVFSALRPQLVVLTTPNAEFNSVLRVLTPSGRRHYEHRFEWTRSQLHEWSAQVSRRYGYTAKISGIGRPHKSCGPPTQLCVFGRE